jgi:hypothetical protein
MRVLLTKPNTPVSAANEQPAEPAATVIVEALDSTARQRSRLALIPALRISKPSIHLKPDEYTITRLPETGA